VSEQLGLEPTGPRFLTGDIGGDKGAALVSRDSGVRGVRLGSGPGEDGVGALQIDGPSRGEMLLLLLLYFHVSELEPKGSAEKVLLTLLRTLSNWVSEPELGL